MNRIVTTSTTLQPVPTGIEDVISTARELARVDGTVIELRRELAELRIRYGNALVKITELERTVQVLRSRR
jgi:hypothetical protein